MGNLEIKNILYQGKWLGIKSAFLGSIAFAFMELAAIYVNTYIIQHMDFSPDFWSIGAFWFVSVFFLLGNLIAYFPARLSGGFLARLLHNDFIKHELAT